MDSQKSAEAIVAAPRSEGPNMRGVSRAVDLDEVR
jgi:hypothetical protein